MFRAHFAIGGSPVLEVVAVTVLHKALPFGGHLCRGLHEVEFGTEIVLVVRFVYLPDIVQKAFERLSAAVLIEQRRGCFIQFVEDYCNKKALCRCKTPLWVKVDGKLK